ncbi:S-layer homology domain-containing protein [Paenibacillus sp. FJAT-26967]|uniref:S-layer homology domain-containing protein n=1 Tax=Paenibacillus sp. FJAT-26967 TaxID=1729690 RepID=UPI0008392B79|nr:S-layer homology domain-containing protein [Paenibacillus sp. FJAT-26967]
MGRTLASFALPAVAAVLAAAVLMIPASGKARAAAAAAAASSDNSRAVTGGADKMRQRLIASAEADCTWRGVSEARAPVQSLTSAAEAPYAREAGGHARSDSPQPFIDVPPDVPGAAAINELAERGIAEGISAGKFDPAGIATREQFAKLLTAASGSSGELAASKGRLPFTDVTSVWSGPYIAAAYASGLTNGTTAVTFSPARPVSRQAAAVMVWRWLEAQGVEAPAGADSLSTAHADSWAGSAVRNLSALIPCSSHADPSHTPKSVMTRGDSAVLIASALYLLENTADERFEKAQEPIGMQEAVELIRRSEQRTADLMLVLFDHQLATGYKPSFDAIEARLLRSYADSSRWRTFYEHQLGGIYEMSGMVPSSVMPTASFEITGRTDETLQIRGKRPEGANTAAAYLTYKLVLREAAWVIDHFAELPLTEPFTQEEAAGIVALYYDEAAIRLLEEREDRYLFEVGKKGEEFLLSVDKNNGSLVVEQT